MSGPRYAFYGDDFTGSTDTLSALVEAGLRTVLFLGRIRNAGRYGPLDAVGIAGAARSMTPDEMDAELPAAFAALGRTGAGIVHYKTCSTFDSAPHIGSIGKAVEIGRRVLDARLVPIVGGQPNLGRYCLFGNLFARAGADGEAHRIDRHPTMSRHPVTPMAEADLRRHLAAQGLADVRSLDIRALRAPDRSSALARLAANGGGAILFDVLDDGDLARIGALIAERSEQTLLAVGPTGVAQAMIAHWRGADSLPHAPPIPVLRPIDPVLVLSGSCSPVTARQIEAAGASGFATLPVDPAALAAAGEGDLDRLAQPILSALSAGRSVVAYTSLGEGGDGSFGRALARATGRLLAAMAQRVRLPRLGIAGGDTSSLAIGETGAEALTLAATLQPGVAVAKVHGGLLDGAEIMLKGGQMGRPDVFDALRAGRTG